MTPVRPDLRLRANRFSEEVFPALRTVGALPHHSPRTNDLPPSSSEEEHLKGGGGTAGSDDTDNDEGLVGVGIGDVQLAWDFVTASEESQLGNLRTMREQLGAWLDVVVPSLDDARDETDSSAESGSGSGAGHVRKHRKMASGLSGPDRGKIRGGSGSEVKTHHTDDVTGVGLGVGKGAGGGSDAMSDDVHDRKEGREETAKDVESIDTDWREYSSQHRHYVRLRGQGLTGEVTNGTAALAADSLSISSTSSSGNESRSSRSKSSSSRESTTTLPNRQRLDERRRRRPRERRRTSSEPADEKKGDADNGHSEPLYRVVKVDINDSDREDPIKRTVWARMKVPMFGSSPFSRGAGLLDLGLGSSGGRGGVEVGDENLSSSVDADSTTSDYKILGGDGNATGEASPPQQQRSWQRTIEVGFVVRVPRCVASGDKPPSVVVQYGHGLFDDRSEVLDGFLGEMAERGAWILVATDWRGMSRLDLTTVAKALISTPELLFSGIPEDLMQASFLKRYLDTLSFSCEVG